jgi:hypothetical protein
VVSWGVFRSRRPAEIKGLQIVGDAQIVPAVGGSAAVAAAKERFLDEGLVLLGVGQVESLSDQVAEVFIVVFGTAVPLV